MKLLQSPPRDPADDSPAICEVAPEAPNCMGGGTPLPRCQPTDPDCGPDPVGDRCYRPSLRRKPWGARWPMPDLACTYDGECVYVRGCGASCVSYRTPARAFTCEWHPSPDGAFCGCVKGYCQLFVQ